MSFLTEHLNSAMEFFTGTNILVMVVGFGIAWGYKKIKAAIKGTALEAELGELIAVAVKAGEDGKITQKEARAIGKEGIDSLIELKALLTAKDTK